MKFIAHNVIHTSQWFRIDMGYLFIKESGGSWRMKPPGGLKCVRNP